MSWSHAGPSVVTSSVSLNSPDGVISGAEFDALDFEFDFSFDTEWSQNWIYFPNNYSLTGPLLQVALQPGGGDLYVTLAQRDAAYVESNVFNTATVPYVLGSTATGRITRTPAGLVTVQINGTPVGSAVHSAEVPVTHGMVHFGNTTPGSTFTLSNVEINTAADTTAPVLSAGSATTTGDTTADGEVTTDEGNGTLYFVATQNATETDVFVKANGATQAVDAAGIQNVQFTGLSGSTSYYPHFLHRDTAGNDSAVFNGAQFTTMVPQLGVTAISDSTPQPGDVVTLTLVNASASGKTLACSAGAIDVVSQDATSVAFNCPHPLTFGAKNLGFGETTTITVTDGAQSATVDIQIQPETSWVSELINALMDDGTYLGAAGVEVGADEVYVTGNGEMIPGMAVFEVGPGITYQYAIRDASDGGVWGALGSVSYSAGSAPDPFTIPAKTGIELSQPTASDVFIPAGYAVDTPIPVSVAAGLEWQVSLDDGASWSAYSAAAGTVTRVSGAPLPRFRVRMDSANAPSTQRALAFTFGGVSASFSVTTRAPVQPVITQHPQAQSVTAGQQASFSVAGTNIANVQWTINGQTVAGQSGTTLNTTQVAAGTYTIAGTAFSSEGGSAPLNPATLTVAGTQPVFTSSAIATANNWSTGQYQAVVSPASASVALLAPVMGVSFNPVTKIATFTFDQPGTYEFTLRATYDGLTTDHVVTVSVDGRPVFFNPASLNISAGVIAPITIEAQDPEGAILTLSALTVPSGLVFTPNPVPVTTVNGLVFTGTLTGSLLGGVHTATFRAVAANGGGQTDFTLTITATTQANRQPVITSSNSLTVTQNESRARTIIATDPDGDALALSLSSAYEWVSLINGQVVASPSLAVAPGSYQVVVTASDGQTPVNQTITILVQELVADGGGAQNIEFTTPARRVLIVGRLDRDEPKTFEKDPVERYDYLVDLWRWLEGDELESVLWTVTDGIQFEDGGFNAGQARVWLSGGAADGLYKATCLVTTKEGRTHKVWFYVSVTVEGA